MRFSAVQLTPALFAVVAFMTACPGAEPAPDAGVDDQVCTNDRDPCESNRDCPGGVCDKVNDGDDIAEADDAKGCCLKLVCLVDDDCADPVNDRCDARRGLCVPRNLCNPADESACPNAGEVCFYTDGNPNCAAAPAATTCSLAPSPGAVTVGGTLQIDGVGKDANGKLIPHTSFTWTASAGSIDADGLLTAPATAGPVTVEGTTENGGVECTTTITVYGAVDPADLRITVFDLATRAPVIGQPVVLKGNGANFTEDVTGSDGSFTFPGGAGAASVSTFPTTHQWQTIIAPATNDIVVYTAAVPAEDPAVDGVKGTFNFDDVSSSGDIRLGLAGMAVSAAITDLDFTTLIGEFVDTPIDIPDVDLGRDTFPLPEGIVIGLSNTDFKSGYVAITDRPGANTVWALGGRVALTKVTPLLSGIGDGEDVNAGSLLASLLPLFSTFDHTIVSGLTAGPLAARTEGDPNFQEVLLRPNTLLSQSSKITIPAMPCAPGGFDGGASRCVSPGVDEDGNALSPFASGAIVLTAVLVPGQGLIPLGISAALDDTDDEGVYDGVVAQEGGVDGSLIVDYAPPHDGLEGNLFVNVVIAADMNDVAETEDGFGMSIITNITRSPAQGETPNTVQGSFLEQQGGTWNRGPTGDFQLLPRGEAASFYRLNLGPTGGPQWNVWFADEAAGTFSMADLHPDTASPDVADRTQIAVVQAFKLGTGFEGPAPTNFDELFAFDGADLDSLLNYLGGWSGQPCATDGICNVPAPVVP